MSEFHGFVWREGRSCQKYDYFKKYPDYVDWALFVVKHKTTISKYIFLIALFIRGLFQTGTKLD